MVTLMPLVLDAGADPDTWKETRLLFCMVVELYAVANVEVEFLVVVAADELGAVPVVLLAADVGVAGAGCVVLFLAVAGSIAGVALQVCESISEAQQ